MSDWGFWQVLLEIVGILVAVGLFLGGLVWASVQGRRGRKRLVYCVISNSPLVDFDVQESQHLELSFKGLPVRNPYFLLIGFYNAGSQSIRAEEFEQSLLILSKEAPFLSASINETFPAELGPQLLLEKNKIEIAPMLLNSEDRFLIGSITDGQTSPSITARIEEIKQIEALANPPLFGRDARLARLMRTGAVLMFIGAMLTSALVISDQIWGVESLTNGLLYVIVGTFYSGFLLYAATKAYSYFQA